MQGRHAGKTDRSAYRLNRGPRLIPLTCKSLFLMQECSNRATGILAPLKGPALATRVRDFGTKRCPLVERGIPITGTSVDRRIRGTSAKALYDEKDRLVI